MMVAMATAVAAFNVVSLVLFVFNRWCGYYCWLHSNPAAPPTAAPPTTTTAAPPTPTAAAPPLLSKLLPLPTPLVPFFGNALTKVHFDATVVNQYIVHFHVGLLATFLLFKFYKSVLQRLLCRNIFHHVAGQYGTKTRKNQMQRITVCHFVQFADKQYVFRRSGVRVGQITNDLQRTSGTFGDFSGNINVLFLLKPQQFFLGFVFAVGIAWVDGFGNGWDDAMLFDVFDVCCCFDHRNQMNGRGKWIVKNMRAKNTNVFVGTMPFVHVGGIQGGDDIVVVFDDVAKDGEFAVQLIPQIVPQRDVPLRTVFIGFAVGVGHANGTSNVVVDLTRDQFVVEVGHVFLQHAGTPGAGTRRVPRLCQEPRDHTMKQDTVVISQQTLFEKIGTGKGCMGEMEINDNVPQGSLDQDGHVVGGAGGWSVSSRSPCFLVLLDHRAPLNS
jgi:hypothetical protein